jgi:metallophosphoesterase superfamily enzyme
LFIGDLHEPFCRSEYIDFCKEMYKKWNIDEVIFAGDIIDNHYSSYHETDPDGHSAAQELQSAKENIAKWYEAFPFAKVCEGNHDALPNRKGMTAGLSKRWIRSVKETLETPNWDFNESFIVDGVLYVHGTGRKARQRARQDMISVAQGHYHSESYVEYTVGKRDKIFALQVGCGMDDKSYASAYGKHFAKMHINVGIILGGKTAFLEYMDL